MNSIRIGSFMLFLFFFFIIIVFARREEDEILERIEKSKTTRRQASYADYLKYTSLLNSDGYSTNNNNHVSDNIIGGMGYDRSDRFYNVPINIGCIQGYKCCQMEYCRKFCNLCYAMMNPEDGGPDGGNNTNGTNSMCDEDEDPECDDEGEEVMPQDLTTTTTTTIPSTTTCDDSNDDGECDDDAEEVAPQTGGPSDPTVDDGNNTKPGGRRGETTTDGKLEFTHHLYEEYSPPIPRESKPPIIIHSVPSYSISNYYTLNRHIKRGKKGSPHSYSENIVPPHLMDTNLVPPPGPFQSNTPIYYSDITSGSSSQDILQPPPMRHITNLHDEYENVDSIQQSDHKILKDMTLHPQIFPHFEKPQTFIYQESPDIVPTIPPQPLLKYHLFHQSYPTPPGYKGPPSKFGGTYHSGPGTHSDGSYSSPEFSYINGGLANIPGPPYKFKNIKKIKKHKTKHHKKPLLFFSALKNLRLDKLLG